VLDQEKMAWPSPKLEIIIDRGVALAKKQLSSRLWRGPRQKHKKQSDPGAWKHISPITVCPVDYLWEKEYNSTLVSEI